jgi:hypothetical protein
VAITPRGGTQTKRWLIPGDTVDSFLDPATGPWLFEVGGPPASHLSLTIESQSPNPLLYGANLEHIKLIQEKLKP